MIQGQLPSRRSGGCGHIRSKFPGASCRLAQTVHVRFRQARASEALAEDNVDLLHVEMPQTSEQVVRCCPDVSAPSVYIEVHVLEEHIVPELREELPDLRAAVEACAGKGIVLDQFLHAEDKRRRDIHQCLLGIVVHLLKIYLFGDLLGLRGNVAVVIVVDYLCRIGHLHDLHFCNGSVVAVFHAGCLGSGSGFKASRFSRSGRCSHLYRSFGDCAGS